jgi:DNA repair protein RecO (recombination protein O)
MPSTSDILDAFTLTGYFLNRHVYEPRGLVAPDARGAYLALIAKNTVSKA